MTAADQEQTLLPHPVLPIRGLLAALPYPTHGNLSVCCVTRKVDHVQILRPVINPCSLVERAITMQSTELQSESYTGTPQYLDSRYLSLLPVLLCLRVRLWLASHSTLAALPRGVILVPQPYPQNRSTAVVIKHLKNVDLPSSMENHQNSRLCIQPQLVRTAAAFFLAVRFFSSTLIFHFLYCFEVPNTTRT